MIQNGIDPPASTGVDQWDTYWLIWLKRLADAFPKVDTYSKELTPVAVVANTTAEQTFTVEGLDTNDVVVVNKPSLDAGLGIVNARVTAADTLGITYINVTAGSLTPATETYDIVSIRL